MAESIKTFPSVVMTYSAVSHTTEREIRISDMRYDIVDAGTAR